MAFGGGYFKTTYAGDLALVDTRLRRTALAALTVALLLLPRATSPFVLDLITQTALAAIGALALNLLTGLAGQVSLGHAGFIAAGAFTTAVLVERAHLGGRRALRLSAGVRLGGGIRLLSRDRVHRDGHHRRPRLGAGRRARRRVRDAAAVWDRRRGRRAPRARRRRVLPVSAQVRRVRAPDGRVPDLRAAGARRRLAPRAQLGVPLAAALPAAPLRVVTPLLELENLEVVYHHVATAIQGVSLRVPPGSIVALLGTNGAGKTTTLRAISGFLGADDAQIVGGRVMFEGATVTGRPPHELARRGLVLVPERDKVFETLTVQENLRALVPGSWTDRGAPRPPATLEQVFHYFPVLAGRRRQLAGYLSGGERQMLALATALLCRPRVLLVDELSLGLAPRVIESLMALVARLRDELGLAVLLVEQNAGAALAVASYGYVMEPGRIVYDGTVERLLAHEDVREFYLGMGRRAGRRSYTEVKQYQRRRRWFWGSRTS